MWRWTLGSLPPPGQPWMTQGELDFQPGWRHGAVPMASPKLSWSSVPNPLQMPSLLQMVAPRCTEAGAPWTQLISLLLQQQPDFPGSAHQDQVLQQLDISEDMPGSEDWVFSHQGQACIPPKRRAVWQCLHLLHLSHSPALCCAARPPVPMQPTPQRWTLQHLLPLGVGEQGTESRVAELAGCCGHCLPALCGVGHSP